MLRLLQLIIFIIVPLANYSIALLGGSDRFDDDPGILNDPAGYAFAIWGPIFIGMIYYSYRIWRETADSDLMTKACYAGISAGLASIAFVPISMSDMQWLSLVNILWHLVSLILLYKYNIEMRNTHPRLVRWIYLGPQMYLGWISAATTISVALALREAGVQLQVMTEVGLTIGLLAVLVGVGLWLASHRGMTVAVVVAWALIGIIVKHGDIPAVVYAAAAGILLTIIGLTSMSRNRPWI